MTTHASQVDIWSIDLDRVPRTAGLVESLDTAERARAARFRRERDRARYVAGRAALRHVLGSYVGVSPGRIELRTGRNGKPGLGSGWLEFNLTHSAGLALLAVTKGSLVGIDVERVGPMPELRPIAERFFTSREAREIAAAPAGLREILFFRCWTRKEAYLKAVGGGLAIPLNSVELTLTGPARIVGIDGRPGQAAAWSLRHLEPAPGFVGAVAVRSGSCRLRCMTWKWDRTTSLAAARPAA